MSVGDVPAELQVRIRRAVGDALRRPDARRRMSGTSLLAVICAAALAPIAAAGMAAGPVLAASAGLAGALGGNALTDIVLAAVARLRGAGEDVSQASVEAELAVRLDQLLTAQGEMTSDLRQAIAMVLRSPVVMDAAVEAAARDERLLVIMAEGFAALSGQFGEFEHLLGDVRQAVWTLSGSLRQQETERRVDRERDRQHALMLMRVLEAVERQADTARDDIAGSQVDPAWRDCPYRGLMPFEERDCRVFYGRGDLVGRLIQRLAERLDATGLLLVVGASGAGKSSLIRAGLMPRLAAGALGPGSQYWPRRVIRPTASPLRELAGHLADLAGTDPVSAYLAMRAAPDQTPLLAEKAVRTAVATRAASAAGDLVPARLLLIVDQLEELFTMGGGVGTAVDRDAFVAALSALAAAPGGTRAVPWALVVAAVRGDFLDRVIAYPSLACAVDTGPFTVGPMSEPELRQAITGPAAEADLIVDPALADTVISQLRAQRAEGDLGCGVLPLLSQAMAATWENREGSTLSLRAYWRAGGVGDAVNRSAQTAYEGLTTGQQAAARLVFSQLTAVTVDGQVARRRCARDELRPASAQLAADADAVIDIFTARRLLAVGADGVEIAHDVLLQAWRQFRDWIGDDRLDRALYSQLVSDARAWEHNHRAAAYLYRPGRLAAVEAAVARWAAAAARYPPIPATCRAFLAAARRAARRSSRRRGAAIACLLILTLAATTAALFAVRKAAEASRQHAIALSRQLAAESLVLNPADDISARRLAVAAWDVYPTSQARAALTTLMAEQQQQGFLPGNVPGDAAVSMAFSPDGTLLAAAYEHGQVRLWNLATEQPAAIPAPSGGADGVAFSPDGRFLAILGADGEVLLWNLTTDRRAASLRAGHGNQAIVMEFSADGKHLIAAAGGTVRSWNFATGQEQGSESFPGNVVALGAGARLLATVDRDGTVRVWRRVTGRRIGPSIKEPDTASDSIEITFSLDGKLIGYTDFSHNEIYDTDRGIPLPSIPYFSSMLNATAFGPDDILAFSNVEDNGGSIRIWNPVTQRDVGSSFSGITVSYLPEGSPDVNSVRSLAFSPDGRLLAAGDSNGDIRLRNLATGLPAGGSVPADTGTDVVNGITFSPDGHLLASAGGDGYLRLWNPATGRQAGASLLATDSRGANGVNGVAFSTASGLLASAGGDGYIRLWNPAAGRQVRTLPAAAYLGFNSLGVNGVAFSPRGGLLAGAGTDGYVRLWSAATGRLVGKPLRADPGSFGGVNGVAFSAGSRLLAAAGTDGYVRLWNPMTGRQVGEPLRADPGVGLGFWGDSSIESAGVNGVAFSPDGGLLAGAGADGFVRMWNPATGGQIARLPADPGIAGGVRGVAFSPDGSLLASADADGEVRLWLVSTGQPIASIPVAAAGADDNVSRVAFSPDGRLLAGSGAGGGAGGIVRIWQVWLFTHTYTALCAEVGPPDDAEWKQYAPGEREPRVCA